MFGERHVYCGVENIEEAIPHLIEEGLGIEIVFDSTRELWPQVRWENLLHLADAVKKAGLAATVHGPFHGINLGSRDDHIREFSEAVLTAGIEVSESFRSPLMVFHTGFVPQLAPKSRVKWLNNLLPGLERILETARRHQVFLAMENTYEEDTELFEEIFERIPHPHLRMCLDTGHATCFGKVEPRKWAAIFGSRIDHIHTSDNDGSADLHWALGSGKVEFETLLRPLHHLPQTITITHEVAGPDVPASDAYFVKLMENLAEYKERTMTDRTKSHPEGQTPKPKHHDLTDAQLERQLRDTDLTEEEYDSLVEEAKRRRRRVDGSGDSLFDNIYSDEP